jgi:hypothetical protein
MDPGQLAAVFARLPADRAGGSATQPPPDRARGSATQPPPDRAGSATLPPPSDTSRRRALPVATAADLRAALAAAAAHHETVLIAGSLFLVGEARTLLLGAPTDPMFVTDPPAQPAPD